MKVFVCTDHDGHWPVGVASVIVAEDESDARTLLDHELRAQSLKDSAAEPYKLRELPIERRAIILNNGDY